MSSKIKPKAIFQIVIILTSIFALSYLVSADDSQTTPKSTTIKSGDKNIKCTNEIPCVYESGGVKITISSGTATAGPNGISCPKGCTVSTQVGGREVSGQVTSLKTVGNTVEGKCGAGGCKAAGISFGSNACFAVEGGGKQGPMGYSNKVTLRTGPESGCKPGATLKEQPPPGVLFIVPKNSGPAILPDGTIINSGNILSKPGGYYEIQGGDVTLKNGIRLTGHITHQLNGNTLIDRGRIVMPGKRIPKEMYIDRGTLEINPSGDMQASANFRLRFDYNYMSKNQNKPVVIEGKYPTKISLYEPCIDTTFSNCVGLYTSKNRGTGTNENNMQLIGRGLTATVPAMEYGRAWMPKSPIQNLIVGPSKESGDDDPITVIEDQGLGPKNPHIEFTHDNVVSLRKLDAEGKPRAFENIVAYNDEGKGISLSRLSNGVYVPRELQLSRTCPANAHPKSTSFLGITGGFLNIVWYTVEIPAWCVYAAIIAGTAVAAFGGYKYYQGTPLKTGKPTAKDNAVGISVKPEGENDYYPLMTRLDYHPYGGGQVVEVSVVDGVESHELYLAGPGSLIPGGTPPPLVPGEFYQVVEVQRDSDGEITGYFFVGYGSVDGQGSVDSIQVTRSDELVSLSSDETFTTQQKDYDHCPKLPLAECKPTPDNECLDYDRCPLITQTYPLFSQTGGHVAVAAPK